MTPCQVDARGALSTGFTRVCITLQLLLLLLSLLSCAPSEAAIAGFSPIGMHHSSWSAKDGAPAAIVGLAQTPDRWLWVASINGLHRFDGIHFERFTGGAGARSRGDIWGMKVMPNGDLWIGYRFGGASLWRNGQWRTFDASDGLDSSSVLDFAQDARGRIWASTALGFRVFDGRRWTAADQGQSGHTGTCLLANDRQGILWARCETGVYALGRNADAFGPKVLALSFGRLMQGVDGTLWATGGNADELVALSGPGKASVLPDWPRPRAGGGPMLMEQDGRHVWSSQATGVVRYGPDERGTVFDVAHGLSGSTATCFFQDDEGNVWVGTENGLDRFRSTALSGVAIPPSYWDAEAIAAGDEGALWVDQYEIKSPDIATLSALQAQDPATAVSVIYKDGDEVWTAGRDGLWHHQGGRRTRLPLPKEVTTMQFAAIARDADGGLWLAARKAGVFRLKDGVWQSGGGHQELTMRASAILRDSTGRMWFAMDDRTIRMLDGRTVHSYGVNEGLSGAPVIQILQSGEHFWVAGADGLYHFDGKVFARIKGTKDEEFFGTSGLIDDGSALWLNGAAGISAIGKDELDQALADPHYRVKFRRLDHLDGLRGAATNFFPAPSAVKGEDGRLWFSTSAGVFWLDTQKWLLNKVPPTMMLKAINVDGVDIPWTTNAPMTIQPNPGRLRIDYTALSYTMPERVRFQYRIAGFDRDWQEAGATRSAVYTALGPGRYRFQVRAQNNDGIWSALNADAEFEVRPATYQTIWFRLLVAGVIALCAWLLYRARVSAVAKRAVEVFAIRLSERERIARDLHDTLLQSIHSLSLRLGTALNRLQADATTKEEIERSLILVEQALQEGQEKLNELRSDDTIDLLDYVCDTIFAEYPQLPLAFSCQGEVRPLDPAVQEQCSALALEALRNAARHAEASQIRFEVIYAQDSFRLFITDNGKGLPPDIKAGGLRAGRWGLVGMSERAAQIGARLIWSASEGGGTTVMVCLAASQAYRKHAKHTG